MRATAISILAFSAIGVCMPLSAAEKIKPGLWEMNMTSDAMKNMPKIPPEQMKKMREMGIHVPDMSDKGMTSKVCITREMAERDQMPMEQNESGCKATNYQRSGSVYSVDILCDGPSLKGQGEVKGKLLGNESFTSTYDFKGSAHGQPVSQRHETSGKWLSADCGNVAPVNGTRR